MTDTAPLNDSVAVWIKPRLLALVIVLCLSSDAKAFPYILNDYTVTVAGYPVGFADWTSTLAYDAENPNEPVIIYTRLYVGPFGSLDTPFSAIYGLLATGFAFVLVIASAVLVYRWMVRTSNSRPT